MPASDNNASQASILIVEDESVVAADISEQLRRDGYRIGAVAKSGEDAVRLARELLPDLVLMDIRLQGAMSGVEAARRISQTVGAPVVYLTAYPGVFIQDPSQMQEPNLCLLKPFVASELRAVIDAALAARGSGSKPS